MWAVAAAVVATKNDLWCCRCFKVICCPKNTKQKNWKKKNYKQKTSKKKENFMLLKNLLQQTLYKGQKEHCS